MGEQERDLYRAVESANLGLVHLDAQGHITAMNPAFAKNLGIEEPHLLGKHWTVTVHPDDHSRASKAYELARTNGRGYVEIRAVRADNTNVRQALTVTPICGPDGALVGYLCVRHDISKYKGEQDVLTLAVESAPNGLLILTADGKIQSINHAVETLFGYSRNELIGCLVEELLPHRFRATHLEHRDAFNRTESKIRMARDLWGLRKDGVEIPLQVHLNRIETHSGELILCTIIDIAERVRYEHQLELAKQAAEAANRAKSDFLSRMSHEIRTPMNLIMGMNALLLESPLNGKQRQHVEISYRNVRRLLRLINGILDLSKVEAGKLTLQMVPFDLNEVLSECAATMASAIEQKGLQLDIGIDPDVWLYWIGDGERLQQVLLNLIGNSIKYTAQGKIDVRVRVASRKPDEKGLRFEISDTGCGVPSDKAGMIFEAFQQAEGSMNRPYEGTGLGLSIAKTIVNMMSGKIWAEEKSGPGAKFVFTAFFPATTEDAVRDKSKGPNLAKQERMMEAGRQILVVEDNPENLVLVSAYLENLPLTLDFATNGLEAVVKRKQHRYDLILMDIQMPIMDGYTATREIRCWETSHREARVPIVALTAHALCGAQAESMAAGCDGHVTKPVDRTELVEAILNFTKRETKPVAAITDPIAARRPVYLANRRLDLEKMKNAFEASDYETIRVIGHNCKGTGSGYGFPDISSIGAQIEKAAKSSEPAELRECLQRFEACLPAV